MIVKKKPIKTSHTLFTPTPYNPSEVRNMKRKKYEKD